MTSDMKLRNILFAFAAVFSMVACVKQEEILVRDTDAFSVDGNKNIVTHYVKASGAWRIETSEDWLSFDPSEGTGDGVNYQAVRITVAYNHGDPREGFFTIVSGSKSADVIVSQGRSNFKFGTPAASGSLVVGETSAAVVTIPYSGASGEEKFDYNFTLSGASAGLSIPAGTADIAEGNGTASIAIEGTPEADGDLTISGTFGTLAVGPLTLKVTKPVSPTPGGETSGVLAKWIFEGAANSEKAAEYEAAYPSWKSEFWIAAMEGKGKLSIVEAAGKTATAINSQSFSGGHLYWKGMYTDDAVLFTCDEVSLTENAEIQFSGCMGGSGSSAGYFLAEYSTDGTNWTAAPGALTETINGASVSYHAAPVDNTTDTNVGTFDVKFKPGAVSGKLYVRLRVSADVRLNHSATVTITTGGGGSTRFKGDLTIAYTDKTGGSTGLNGIPCGWNFYALGMAATDIQSSEAYGKNWFGVTSADAYVPATSGGNIDAKLQTVFVNGTCTNRTFNPSIQVQGMLIGDYWLVSIPVSGLAAGTPLDIEVGCGGAGGSVGFYFLEYSSDKTNWTAVPGATLQTRGEDSFLAHLWNTPSSIGASGYTNTRKSYDKTTDDTYHKYTIEAPAIADGTLYFRLVVLKYRATPASTMEVGAGWTDLKGFEVSLGK